MYYLRVNCNGAEKSVLLLLRRGVKTPPQINVQVKLVKAVLEGHFFKVAERERKPKLPHLELQC